MKKYIRSKIATSLILSQLISSNMCCAGNYTSKTWQEKSVEKLQSFAREIKSSIKADPGWWIGGTALGVGLATIIVPSLVYFSRRMSQGFEQEYQQIAESIVTGQVNSKQTIIEAEKLRTVISGAKIILSQNNKSAVESSDNIELNGINGDFYKLIPTVTKFLANPKKCLIVNKTPLGSGSYNTEVLYVLCSMTVAYPGRIIWNEKVFENLVTEENLLFVNAEIINKFPQAKELTDQIFSRNNETSTGAKISTDVFAQKYGKLKNGISGGTNTVTAGEFSVTLTSATACLKKDDMVININTNGDRLLIASDIHGDFKSLSLVIDEFLKHPNKTKLLFLGDYVDRGDYSVEVLYTLALLKICYPDRVFLLRGNHDTQGQPERNHPYVTEFNSKFSGSAAACIDARTDFDSCLSLAAIVDNKFVCTHAGFGPSGTIDWARKQKKPLKYDISYRDSTYSDALEDLLCIRASETITGEATAGYSYGVSSLDDILKGDLKCLIHGHNHGNTHTFNDPREICVCTNPLNWANRLGQHVIRNLPVGLIEIQNNTLKLLTYDYKNLSGSPETKITQSYN